MAYPHLDASADLIMKALAQQIAQEYELDYVGTEHVLLAILRHGGGVGAAALSAMGVTEQKVRATLDELLQREKEDTWVLGRLPGSPHYRNVVALAIDEATQLESPTIGSEHLLLALLREPGSMAQRILEKLGVTLQACRKRVLSLMEQEKRPS